MANIWVDGFEGLALDSAGIAQRYDFVAGDASISAAGGRGGGAALSPGGTGTRKVVPVAAGYIFGFAFKATPDGSDYVNIDCNGISLAKFGVDTLGRVYALTHGSISIFTVLPAMRVIGVYRYSEHKVVVNADPGGGSLSINYQLKIDNQIVATVNNFVSSAFGRVGVDQQIASILFSRHVGLVDDFYINDLTGAAPDNDYWGDTRMGIRRPNGAISAQFTPTPAVANYLNVDDPTTDNAATHNDSSTVGHKDEFDFEDSTLPGGTVIRTVGIMTSAARLTTSGPRQIKSFIKHGGIEVQGGTHDLSDTYYIQQQLSPTCPSTSAAWTPAQLNAATGGYVLNA